jgi:hypothetical protein
MKNSDLIKILKEMPADAEVCIGVVELEGFMLFNFDQNDVQYKQEVKSYGNCSPRPPSHKENVVVIEMG